MAARTTHHFIAGFLEGDGFVVRALEDHGVDGINDRKTACANRNFFTPKALRITATIEFFMMGVHNLAGRAEKIDIRQKISPVLGVPAHDEPLVFIQRTWLKQHGVRNFQFTDVVQERALLDLMQLFAGYPNCSSDSSRPLGYPLGMPACTLIAKIQGRRKSA